MQMNIVTEVNRVAPDIFVLELYLHFMFVSRFNTYLFSFTIYLSPPHVWHFISTLTLGTLRSTTRQTQRRAGRGQLNNAVFKMLKRNVNLSV